MNINRTYIEDYGLIKSAYNHYVHYVMTEWYKKETKEEGKNAKDDQKKLKNARFKHGVANDYPRRYLDILADIDAHSDDEWQPNLGFYVGKTLKYRSKKANEFIVCVDEEMLKSDQIEGKCTQHCHRHQPKTPIMSSLACPPKNFPLDFFSPAYFNDIPASKKTIITNTQQVVFLPKPKLSFRPVSQEDEKLSDKKFTNKYWESATVDYDLSHEIGRSDNSSEDSDDEGDKSYCGESIDLEGFTSGEEDEGEDECIEEGKHEDHDDDMSDIMMGQQAKDDARAARWDASQIAGPSKWDDWQ
ncbi:hypothetical protein CROQUDRAFT_91657 [Cronartium quercuum f. sp. fusiforme G11]|uniref:Uncharacterized protein n=1 Tax=Cronartium quercuum f. sp. fusiforme G11 TaxID=708437 RepID=A0A9P6NNC4_9BASI|nr:hypothetical protein CROQUDRAFT_91657 [Cronartium quercuum f. sp. fusiforme G11]